MQDLFNKLFHKSIDDAGATGMLQDITREHPYFTAAHFYLLKQTPATDPGYAGITAKTALHFNNPFLLNYRLNHVKKLEVIEKVETVHIQKEEEKAEPVKPVPEVVEVVNLPTNEPMDTNEKPKEEMLFEPLYATDYFASQGIKLSEEVQPGDKLGKQLKSFTEWLKGMKKVHGTNTPLPAANIDTAVETLAEKSNQQEEVITESMAEAYVQQGKMKQARETFEKLSLLNPAKSAYFAAKIEQIPLND